MLAYHNDPKVKEKYLARVKAHAEADEIIKGKYWENGKGCAVGCTIHGSQHQLYETELGIPIQLAHLEDYLFESLPNEKAREWPYLFLDSIRVGGDLSCVWQKWVLWQLADAEHGVIKYTRKEDGTYLAVHSVIELYQSWPIAAGAVGAATRAAKAAAWAAGAAMTGAWAAEAAAGAAAGTAGAAKAAAWAAAEAVEAAAGAAAEAVEAAKAAAWAARAAVIQAQADKLVELLKSA